MDFEQLKNLRSLPLEVKVEHTKLYIYEWWAYWHGRVYVSFSGGKDSTVLLDIARQVNPDIPAMFVDTGLEYPEIREFVKTFDNVTWMKPKMNFKEVIKTYGYPVISKEQAQYIYTYRNTKSEKLRKQLWEGVDGKFKISERWKHLVDAPFKISSNCCNIMKKVPAKKYNRATNRKAIIGSMGSESYARERQLIRHKGCNAYDMKQPRSTPLGFWTEQDILQYIQQNNLPYASVYGWLVKTRGNDLTFTGVDRTGCMFCMFGITRDGRPNRFQRMADTHPEQYKYCMETLNIAKVLTYLGVDYKPITNLKTIRS